jgi:hypothetical protein
VGFVERGIVRKRKNTLTAGYFITSLAYPFKIFIDWFTRRFYRLTKPPYPDLATNSAGQSQRDHEEIP